MKVIWAVLFDPELRKILAGVVDILGKWLNGEITPEEATKQLITYISGQLLD